MQSKGSLAPPPSTQVIRRGPFHLDNLLFKFSSTRKKSRARPEQVSEIPAGDDAFTALPVEVLLLIRDFLFADTIGMLRRTCRGMYNLLDDPLHDMFLHPLSLSQYRFLSRRMQFEERCTTKTHSRWLARTLPCGACQCIHPRKAFDRIKSTESTVDRTCAASRRILRLSTGETFTSGFLRDWIHMGPQEATVESEELMVSERLQARRGSTQEKARTAFMSTLQFDTRLSDGSKIVCRICDGSRITVFSVFAKPTSSLVATSIWPL